MTSPVVDDRLGVMPRVDVTRTYLELKGPGALRPAREPAMRPRLERRPSIGADEYLVLYRLVGDRWHWHDRLAWPAGVLDAHLASPGVQVWVATMGDEVAGYFELQDRHDDTVEIVYFGLAPAFIGQGLGGWLLVRACECAFAMGISRVVLNTCSLDGPHAMANYMSRGFTFVRDEVYEVELNR